MTHHWRTPRITDAPETWADTLPRGTSEWTAPDCDDIAIPPVRAAEPLFAKMQRIDPAAAARSSSIVRRRERMKFHVWFGNVGFGLVVVVTGLVALGVFK